MAPSGRKKDGHLKKEDVISALLIADDFETKFGVLEEDEPKILLPLVNLPVIDYTLEFLHSAGVQEVVVFCCGHANKIKEYIRNSKWANLTSGMSVTITISETCMSVGDALRDVYDKRLLTEDFILIIGGVVSNMQLKPLLEHHREQKKKDKSTVMTTLFSRHSMSSGRKNANSTVVAYLEDTNRIVFLQNMGSNKKVSIPLDVFLENSCVSVCYDLLDCQISICSSEVLYLFADNFDYQSRNDFIKGVLVQEEVLGNTVYICIVDEGYAASVNDLPSYKAVSHDIISRWAFPIAPEQMVARNGEVYSLLRHNIYKHAEVVLKGSQLITDVVIGKKSKIGSNCIVSRSVIGDNCEIGSNVYLKDAFIWDNAKVGSNCKIDSAIVASHAKLGNEVEIYNCVLGEKIVVETGAKIDSCFKSATNLGSDDFAEDEKNQDKDSENGDADLDPWLLKSLSDGYSSSDDDANQEDSEGEEIGGRQSPELDDTKLFYRELRDTLIRGLEEKLTCDNLILEINSLKYAYNVTVAEVNHLLTKAVLDISGISLSPKEKLPHLKQLLTQFRKIFSNYMKTPASQLDLLNSLKEYAIGNKNCIASVANIIHFLYEIEILLEEVIIEWHGDLLEDDKCENEMKSKVTPLIKWLEEAEEESE